MKSFIEWHRWTDIMHYLLFVLTVYVVFVVLTKKQERTTTNMLLLSILVGLEVVIHEMVNKRNREKHI